MNVIDFRFRPNTPEIINGIKNSAMFKAACKAIGFDARKPQPLDEIVADLNNLGVELIAVRLRVKKKVQNLNAMWYKEFAKNFATQGDFGHESP